MSVVEIVTLSLLPDAEVPAFLEADHDLQAAMSGGAAGLVRRTTARDGDTWLILTLWRTAADAERGWEAGGERGGFLGFVDVSTVRRRVFATLD